MNATIKRAPLADPREIIRALSVILPAGQVTELRALDATINGDRFTQTHSGYFDDPHKLAAAASSISTAKAIYIIPNAIDRALLSRASNRVRAAKKEPLTSDHDVTRRRFLLIDADAKRPAGISSTDAEHDAAINRLLEVREDLRLDGWPDPLLGDSGNGAHLMYAIDLPADDGGLIERCLQALDAKYSDGVVKIDTTVFNPARIWKLYGTRACKGDDTPERPHRMSKLIEVPDVLLPIPQHLLDQLAAKAPAPAATEPHHGAAGSGRANGNGHAFDLENWIRSHNVPVEGPEPWKGGQRWIFPVCPWNSDHTNRSAFILKMPGGAADAGCHHEGCKGKGWHDLRDLFEPGWQRRHGPKRSNGSASIHGDPTDFALSQVLDAEQIDSAIWVGSCPLHTEPNRFLSIRRTPARHCFIECSQGCDKNLIVSRWGICLNDLYSSRQNHNGNGRHNGEAASAPPKFAPTTVRVLQERYPHLRRAVVHGLSRESEILNIIAPPKTGKSWLVIDLLLACATGRPWLGLFKTEPGNVLLIDNELHPETIANRIPQVAQARGILSDEYADRVFVESLRGRLRNLVDLSPSFHAIEPGRFKVIVLDSFYRFLPEETDENSNGAITTIYNHLDAHAARLGCTFVLIHHASKGSQSDKAVTDVGAGAGSQARASDSHLILRPHEQDGCVVLDAAVRSWPPVERVALRWNHPIWQPAPELDPAQLKRPHRTNRPGPKIEQPDEPKPRMTIDDLMKCVSDEPRSRDWIVSKAVEMGFQMSEAQRLLNTAVEDGKVHQWPHEDRRAKHRFASREPTLTDAAAVHAARKMNHEDARKCLTHLLGIFHGPRLNDQERDLLKRAFLRLEVGRVENLIEQHHQIHEKIDVRALVAACEQAAGFKGGGP